MKAGGKLVVIFPLEFLAAKVTNDIFSKKILNSKIVCYVSNLNLIYRHIHVINVSHYM